MVCRSLYVLLLWSWYRRKAWAEDRGGGLPREKVRLWDGGKPAKHPDPTNRTKLTSLERGGRGFFYEVLAGICGAVSEGMDAWCKRQLEYCWGVCTVQNGPEKYVKAEPAVYAWYAMPNYDLDDDAESAFLNEGDGVKPNVEAKWWIRLKKLLRWPLSGETEAQRTKNNLHKDIKAQCEEALVVAGIIERATENNESARRASKERLDRLKQACDRAKVLPKTARAEDTKELTSVLDSIEQAIKEAKGPNATPPTASRLIADELSRRLTWSALYVSVAADIDLALDWVFFSQLVRRSRDSSKPLAEYDPGEAVTFCDSRLAWNTTNVPNATERGFCDDLQGDFIPPRFMIVAAVFAALGTVLWALAAFDLLAWGLDYISLLLFKRAPSPDVYPSRGVVLLLNLALEDVPQIVISSVVTAAYDGGGTAISSLALANIVTSVYSLLFKVMATFESSGGEYTIPAMISVAPLARGEMEQRRRARDASSRTAREYAVAAANRMRLLQGIFDKDVLVLDAWSDVPPADTMRGGAWRRRLRAAKTVERLRIRKLRGKAEVEDVFEVLNQKHSSIVTLDLDRQSSSDDPAIDAPGVAALREALQTNKALTRLNLSNNSIGEASAEALAKALKTNKALTRLNLSNNSIGEASAEALAKALKTNKALAWLNLSNNSIGDAGAEALAKALKTNKALAWLYLDENSIDDAGAQALAEALQTNGALTELWLGNNSIGDAGAQALAEALMTNKALTRLDLDINSIGDAGAQALAEALMTNTALTRLDLGNNSIGDAGAQALAEALMTNKALTRLDLDINSIGDAGAQALAEALMTNTALTRLDLDRNSIGDAGAQALAEALKTNKALTELYLYNNSIGDAGAQALAEGLKTNKALMRLNLNNNSIGVAGAQALAEALKTNEALTDLYLDENSIGDAGAQALAEAERAGRAEGRYLTITRVSQKKVRGSE